MNIVENVYELTKQHLNPFNLTIMENKLTGLPDGNLISLWKDGNDEALSVLIHRHKNKIFTYIMLMVKNKHLAEDIFQDVFIRVIGVLAKGEYKESNKFLPWVTRIAHNCCIDYFRKQKRTPLKELGNWESEDPSKNQEGVMIREQSRDQISILLDALPEVQREVILLRHYGDLSFREIAQIMNCSINTALGRMRYGLINLRKMIKEKNINL